jgi:sugar lactone lactonase YvrE
MFISMVSSKRIAYLAILVFFLFLAKTSFPEPLPGGQQKPDALIKEGIELYNSGQYEDAIIMLKQATGLTKDKRLLSDAFFCLSLCYFQLGDLEDTKEFIRKTIEVEPKKKIDENRYAPEYYALFLALSTESPTPVKGSETRVVSSEGRQKRPGGGIKWGRIALIGVAVILVGVGVYFFVLRPKTGNIDVKSTPDGAQIFLDGADTGKKTNAILEDVSLGNHTVKLVKDGYEVHEENVSVQRGKTAGINAHLSPTPIKVTQPDAASTWPKGRTAEIKWETTSSTRMKTFQGASRFTNMTDGSSYLRRLGSFRARDTIWRGIRTGGSEAEGLKSRSATASGKSNSNLERFASSNLNRPETRLGSQDIKAQGLYVNPQQSQSQSANKQDPFFGKTAIKSQALDIAQVNIDLYKGAEKKETIASATDNDGNHSWEVPTTLPDGTDYKVRVSCSTAPEVFDDSDPFSIQEGNIKITMPTLDKVWGKGVTKEIQWTSSFPANERVAIDLMKGTEFVQQIEANTKNDGSHPWTIPSDADFEEYWDYRIRITLASDADVKGESPSFTITKITYVVEIDRTLPYYEPHGVTVDNAGNVWVAQTNGNQLHNLGPNINYPGTGYYDFNQPKGIASQGGYLYLVDSGYNRIMRIDSSGTRYPKDGSPDTSFVNPYGIAVDADYNVYVTDGNNRVQKFYWGTSFSYVTQWQAGGNPRGIACDPDITRNSVYVTDGDNKEVHAYSLTGEEIRTWSIDGNPFGIAVDKWGFVYVVDANNDRFLKYTPKGILCGAKGGLFQNPIDIYVDSSGRVLVTDWGDSRIVRLQ